jgi:NitT/TauT family transport system permease protein
VNAAAKKRRWFDDPRVALDGRYWKPKAEYRVWLAVTAFALALAVSLFAPNAEKVNPVPFQAVLGAAIFVIIIFYAIGIKNLEIRKKLYHKADFLTAAALAVILWEALTVKSGIAPLPYFPSLDAIFAVLVDDRRLVALSALYSLRLFFTGLVTGTALGLGTGVLIGWNRHWDYWLSPVIRVTGIVPAVAWLPIALLLLPSSFAAGVFLIVISSWFPVSSMAASGIAATPKAFYEVGKTLGADRRFLLFHTAIPNAMPSIFMGIQTAAAFSFTTLIVSEMVGAKAGLGFYINWAKGWGAYAKVYAAIIIIAVEFSLILAFLGALKHSVLRWQKGFVQ